MKFAVIGPVSPVRGGIAHHTTELCKHLQKDHSVTVFSLERLYQSLIHRLLYKGNSTLDYNAQECNYKKNTTLSINPFSWLIASLQIRKIKPDYVIVTWVDPFLVPLLLVIKIFLPRRTKLALICHELSPQEGRLFGNVLNKLAFKIPDAIIVHSEQDVGRIRKISKQTKVVKLFHPTYDFFYKKMDRKTSKKQLNIKEPILLFFGYIREYKGLAHLIRALPSVLKTGPITLLVVGEFWDDKTKYLNLIRELNVEKHVKIIDRYVPNEEVPIYFSAADVVVVPYLLATQSGVINIAYAFDRPVIATDVGGLPEIVVDGRTGYIVPPQNSAALADAIIRFYNTDSNIFNKNVKQIRKDFSWEIFCKKLIKELND